jgi:cytochrome c oxidase assembly factor CtaG
MPRVQSGMAVRSKVYNNHMKLLLLYAGFLFLWFFVLPRIPGVSRFT